GGMDVVWRSHINGVESGGPYEYIPFTREEDNASAQGGGGTPPDESLRPVGTNWFCTHAKATTAGSASRRTRAPKDCEAYRRTATSKKGHPKMTACTEQHDAACFTMTLGRSKTVSCFDNPDDCTAAAEESRKNGGKRAVVSDCAAW